MKSSEAGRRSRGGGRAELAVALLVMLGAAAFVRFARPRLAGKFHRLKVASDVYVLPSPDKAVALSLGWRSALADLLFAHTLVSYGIHIQEKRRFEFAGSYLETVVELDPKFRAPYRYCDTLLTLGALKPRDEDWGRARRLLERGMQEYPFDAELWTQAGQFMAYLAPGSLRDDATKQEWRVEGARRMARACELIGNNENVPFHCITAATILSKAGEREATIQFLERVLTVVDNDDVRSIALSYLQRTADESARDRVQWRTERFIDVWRSDLSYITKEALLVAGPPLDLAGCAGRGPEPKPGCAVTWRSWGEQSGRR
ncbi:MAG: hypothetical protein L6Q84_08025 [Polyangiaceae bacterium]|nr:hypothetical protein [Polyangiaceae bacterium]